MRKLTENQKFVLAELLHYNDTVPGRVQPINHFIVDHVKAEGITETGLKRILTALEKGGYIEYYRDQNIYSIKYTVTEWAARQALAGYTRKLGTVQADNVIDEAIAAAKEEHTAEAKPKAEDLRSKLLKQFISGESTDIRKYVINDLLNAGDTDKEIMGAIKVRTNPGAVIFHSEEVAENFFRMFYKSIMGYVETYRKMGMLESVKDFEIKTLATFGYRIVLDFIINELR